MRLIDPPGGKPWALLGLCGGSVLLNIVLIGARLIGGPAGESAEPIDEPADIEAAAITVIEDDAVPTPPLEPVAVEVPGDVNIVHASVSGSLAETFQKNAPEGQGDVLSAVVARLFVFDLKLRSDLMKGDSVDVAYTWDGALADVQVASFASTKLGKTLDAYKFKATGDTYASYWDESGREMAPRLVDGPLDNYEQITSLLKDRPKHHGMDFKTPEGTEVHAPKDATVVRTNWNWSNNGDCVELAFADGVHAKFLHLARVDVEPGQKLAKGTQLGLTGNTGHSTAPHLHYELDKNGTIVDPIDYHGTTFRTLPEADNAAFQAERERLDAILASGA